MAFSRASSDAHFTIRLLKVRSVLRDRVTSKHIATFVPHRSSRWRDRIASGVFVDVYDASGGARRHRAAALAPSSHCIDS
jgi:hypothetical protein